MSTSKRKHKTLSLRTKMYILDELDSGAKANDLASFYGVGRATICDIRKNRERISHCVGSMVSGPGKRYTLRFGDFPQVDSALYKWYLQERSLKAPMSGELLREKAKEIYRSLTKKDNFRASDGWLDKFKKRFDIRLSRVSTTGSDAALHQTTTSTSAITNNLQKDCLKGPDSDEQGKMAKRQMTSSFDFLNEYVKYPCLWDKGHPKFGSEASREAAGQELTNFLKLDDPKGYIRKLKAIENNYYKDLTNSYSILQSNPDAKFKLKPWFELAKRFFGKLGENSHEVSISLPLHAEDESSMTETEASTSSFTEPFKDACSNEPNLTEGVGQSTSSQVEIETNDPLKSLHTCVEIKEECDDTVNINNSCELDEFNDTVNRNDSAGLEEFNTCVDIKEECYDTVNRNVSGGLGEFNDTVTRSNSTGLEEPNDQYEPSQIKIEEPLDETAMAVNAITSFDEHCSESTEPFIQIICPSTNSPKSTHTEVHSIDNTSSRKRSISGVSSTARDTDEITEYYQGKVAKPNSSESTSELTNEFAIFGQYVASQMQQLPLCSSLQLQCEIHNLIVEARLEHANENK